MVPTRSLMLSIATSLLLLALWSCNNPFFPKKVTPVFTGADEPEDVITLLQEAYTQTDINIFKDLIYDEEQFNSYVFVGATETVFPYSAITLPDSVIFDTVVSKENKYVPLDYSDELKIHRNLFNLSDELYFRRSLVPTSVDYVVYTDSLGGLDTSHAILKCDGAEIVVTAEKYGLNNNSFYISGQYFLLKKDKKYDVWKIWKWIEINN